MLDPLEIIIRHAWGFLTVRDLWNLRAVSSTWWNALQAVEYTSCRDGKDYVVPFPGYPAVSTRLFPHQLASLKALHQAEHPPTISFGCLRGGILADAPGLGKTLTMLSLVASTAGVRPVTPHEFWNNEAIAEGWKWTRQNPEAKSLILRALKPIRMFVNDLPSNHPTTQLFKEVQARAQPPFKEGEFNTLSELERYVLRSLQHSIPHATLELTRQQLLDIRASLDKKARKILCSPNGRRLVWERNLIPTSATLVVVPDALLEHWFQQIVQHWRMELFADSLDQNHKGRERGVVYIMGVGDLADIREGHQLLSSSQPHGKSSLVQAWDLAKYLVVLTTFSRCEKEMKKQWQLNKKRSFGLLEEETPSQTPQNHQSSILRLRWLRLIVDEGHELGSSHSWVSTMFIQKIAAERRWVLSGTPTTGDVDDEQYTAKALDQLERLFIFLRHPKYGVLEDSLLKSKSKSFKRKKAKMAWENQIKLPFLAKQAAGRDALLTTLKAILVRHQKEDIYLPKPVFEQIETDVTIPEEVEERVLRETTPQAMALFLDRYLHSPEFQSLVDKSQAEYIVRAVEQAHQELLQRGGPLSESHLLTWTTAGLEEGKEIISSPDRRPIKAVIYSSEKNNLWSVVEQVIRSMGRDRVAELNENSNIGDMSYELSRFRNGERKFRICPVCGRENDAHHKKSQLNRCSEMLIEVVLITENSTDRFLIEPERIVRTINVPEHRLEGEQLSNYCKLSKFWRVGDVLEVDIRANHPVLFPRKTELEWEAMGATTCKSLAERDQYEGPDWYFGPLPEATDDTTGDHLRRVRLVKWQSCGKYHNNSRWYTGPRLVDFPVQQVEENVSVLALDAGLSHGLDLSFVTHIFLLEPIHDAAVLEQVSSRAHRMGATHPVTIATIHPFYKIQSTELKFSLERIKSTTSGLESQDDGKRGDSEASSLVFQDRQATLMKIVCQYCFREFDTNLQASTHEANFCPRNPNNQCREDDFNVLSIYREVRPPLPALASVAPSTKGKG